MLRLLRSSTGADPVAQIEGFITKGETEKLKKIAPTLRSSPELLKAFNQALDITLSRMAPKRSQTILKEQSSQPC